MDIKKLQNNFTTHEQSKRLLELGVPADSADCYLLRTHTKGDTFIVEVLHDELYSKKDKFTNMLEYLPCWSVGRLIKILKVCVTNRNELHEIFEELEMCIDEIEVLVQTFKEYSEVIDFSKLEE